MAEQEGRSEAREFGEGRSKRQGGGVLVEQEWLGRERSLTGKAEKSK